MIVNKLRELGIDLKGRTSGQFKTYCPVCFTRKGHRKDNDLSVDIDSGKYKCHSPHCSFHGQVRVDEYKRPVFEQNKTNLPLKVVQWFKERGLSQEVVVKMKTSFDGKNIEFNYFESGILANYKKRPLEGKTFYQFPDAKKVLFNIDSCFNADRSVKEEIIIVEGEPDVYALVDAGLDEKYGIVSLENGAGAKGSVLDGKLEGLKNAFYVLKNVKKFILAGDMDEPGEYTFREIARRLGEIKCVKVNWGTDKDANDKWKSLQKVQDMDMAKMSMSSIIMQAEPYPVSGIIRLDDDMQARMIKAYREGREMGVKINDEIGAYWSVLASEITLFHGYPADGKSTFVRNIAMMYAMKHGAKFGCYVPEDAPAEYFYEDLCHVYIGKSTDERANQERASESEYLSAMGFVKDHFFFIYPEPDENGMVDLPTNQWINEKLNFLKMQYGINGYIKDPWNKIMHDMSNEREDHYLAKEISREKIYARTFTYAFYVHHPKNAVPNKDGSFPVPTRFNLSGGAMFNNGFDNIICVFRPNRHQDKKDPLVRIIFEKIKKKKLVGNEGQLDILYSAKENRYHAFDDYGFKQKDNSDELWWFVDKENNIDFGELPF